VVDVVDVEVDDVNCRPWSIEYGHLQLAISLSWKPGGRSIASVKRLWELTPGRNPMLITSHLIHHPSSLSSSDLDIPLSARYPPSYPFEVDIPPVRDVVEGLSPLIALVAFGNGILFCSGNDL
jgi:hypothetical protein